MKEKVQKALDGVRSGLQADGGDIELVNVSDDGVVQVKLTGACGSCPMAQMTLQFGVTKAVKDAVPEVKEVQAV
ncbi:MAG: NifU family protein [Elusimicrobiota bacterium]|nr:NifU family protein [Elusimicrobiota bacterium]